MTNSIKQGITRTKFEGSFNSSQTEKREAIKKLLKPLVSNDDLLSSLTQPHVVSQLRKHFRFKTTFYNEDGKEIMHMKSIGKTDLFQLTDSIDKVIPKNTYIDETDQNRTIKKHLERLEKNGCVNQVGKITNGRQNVHKYIVEMEFIK